MDYVEVELRISPPSTEGVEMVTALLAEAGFDSFAESPGGLLAYIPAHDFTPHRLEGALAHPMLRGRTISRSIRQIPDQNWNRRWESNFDPIAVEGLCRIRAPFHPPAPGYRVELVIEPKMAFGTGHHQTTWLMARALFDLPVQGQRVLDMGCGTGILAILAHKLGAKAVTAIDVDRWAWENAQENARRNGCPGIEVLLGDAGLLRARTFDLILANITRNVLANDLPRYAESLAAPGAVAMSGFHPQDIPVIQGVAAGLGLVERRRGERDGWATLTYTNTRSG